LSAASKGYSTGFLTYSRRVTMGPIAGMGFASALDCEGEANFWGIMGTALGFIALLLM